MNIQAELDQFTGTMQWHKINPHYPVLATDGIKYMADKCGAWWLLDEVWLQLHAQKAFQKDHMWVVEFTCRDNRGMIKIHNGQEGKARINLKDIPIHFTDFPLDSIKFWAHQQGKGCIFLLPSEY